MRRRSLLIALTSSLCAGVLPVAASSASADLVHPAAAHHSQAAERKTRQVVVTAIGGRKDDLFGSSVAIAGRTIVVGAPCHRTVATCQGAVYVFHASGAHFSTVHQIAKFTVKKGRHNDAFGTSVAISGSTIVVGAPFVTNGTNLYEGAVYVFSKPAAGWGALHHPKDQLVPNDRAAADAFGTSVAISGQTVVVGSPGHPVGQHTQQGAAYVYVRPHHGWAVTNPERAELTTTGGASYDHLGNSVSISGHTIVAGAPYHRVKHISQGAAYVFTEPKTGWTRATQSAELVARGGATRNYFGDSVSVSGNTIAAGAPDHRVGKRVHQGTGYVFTKPSGGWAGTHRQNATLTVLPGVKNAYFGQGVVTNGSLVIGFGFGLDSVFRRPPGGWSGTRHQHAQLTGASPLDFLGTAIAIAGHAVVGGAPTQTVGGHVKQGAAYVYYR